MSINSNIEGVSAEVKGNILVIKSKSPLKVLSSAIYNGGLKNVEAVLNIQVAEGSGSDKTDFHWNPDDFLNEQIQKLRLNKETTVALMTAAKMQNLSVCSEKCGDTALMVFTTAGKTVSVTAGEATASKGGKKHGTINIIVLVDGNMTDACMVETVKTLTEAKTVALRELDLRSQFSGDLATGTLTDSLVVACTKRGELTQFAGTYTLLGELIGKCVRKTVKEAMFKQESLTADRSLRERLAERGLTYEVLESFIVGNPNREQLFEKFDQLLSDKNVAKLVLAGLHLDEDLQKGLFPSSTVDRMGQEEFVKLIGELFPSKESKDQNPLLGPYTQRILLAVLSKAFENVEK
jgi:adenosylcobinamide hydrolase